MEGREQVERNLMHVRDSIVYDMFYESGTMLRGALVNSARRLRENGQDTLADELMREFHMVDKERRETNPLDRAEQIERMLAWDSRRNELDGIRRANAVR